MNKLNIRLDNCIGCGSCIAIDPEHFDFNEDGLAKIISNDNLETHGVENAIEACPTSVITLDIIGTDETCECETVEEPATSGCDCTSGCAFKDMCGSQNEKNEN